MWEVEWRGLEYLLQFAFKFEEESSFVSSKVGAALILNRSREKRRENGIVRTDRSLFAQNRRCRR
jgi:hypothetical protein